MAQSWKSLAVFAFLFVLLTDSFALAASQHQHKRRQGRTRARASCINKRQTTAATATETSSGAESTCLDASALQSGSTQQGALIDPAQAPSETDGANFINVCKGKTLTNGLQVRGGSCNGIPMGDIPSTANMISAFITSPLPGAESNIQANTAFDVKVSLLNFQLGSFTDPASTYYAAPQRLNGDGKIIGHCHITIQKLNGQNIPDPSKFDFFKGVNDDGDKNGHLQVTVTAGLAAGDYRICTINSGSNHQPVIMPVAQRGAQDDCIRITIGAGGGGNSGNTGGDAAATSTTVDTAATSTAVDAAATTSTTAGAAATTTTAAAAATSSAAAGGRGNLNKFGGTLGSGPVQITNSGNRARPFSVEGNTFVNFQAACARACDIQANKCSDAANGSGNRGRLSVGACSSQGATCKSTNCGA